MEINLGQASVFNSIYTAENDNDGSLKLLQHFKGWVIETKEPVFNTAIATMMDFKVHQQHGTTFAYILPFSATTALIEYTLFTKALLPIEQYDKELQSYISSSLQIREFEIKETEFGVIPMTNKKFQFYRDGMYHIGSAGGQTKGSSGYTFQFIQKQSQQIVDCLLTQSPLDSIPATPRRFRFYDNTLLEILYHNKIPGKKIFTTLFKKNKPRQVLKFLDNESSIIEELKIISSLPTWPFLKAALKQL